MTKRRGDESPVPPKLFLEKGAVFRIGGSPNIEKGKWYWVVTCKGCGEPIYLFDDPLDGLDQTRFVGEGHMSIPCQHCHADERYGATDLRSIKAEVDIENRPRRRAPSNRPRQPLYKRYPNARPTFGPGFLEGRPEAAALIGRCIALWADVESELARLLAAMLRANTEPAIAVFLALRSSRAQFDALNAAAQVVLDEADYELFAAIMNIRQSVEKERNHLAHGSYGGSPQVKEGILWIDPVHLTQYSVKAAAAGVTTEALEWLRRKVFVYEPGDIETIAREIENLHDILRRFTGYLSIPDAGRREEQYRLICVLPRLRKELARMRAGQTAVET